VLRSLRNGRGGPAPHVRLIAALLVIGLFMLSAPVALPVVRWALGLVF
jgi:hypothetical protein